MQRCQLAIFGYGGISTGPYLCNCLHPITRTEQAFDDDQKPLATTWYLTWQERWDAVWNSMECAG